MAVAQGSKLLIGVYATEIGLRAEGGDPDPVRVFLRGIAVANREAPRGCVRAEAGGGAEVLVHDAAKGDEAAWVDAEDLGEAALGCTERDRELRVAVGPAQWCEVLETTRVGYALGHEYVIGGLFTIVVLYLTYRAFGSAFAGVVEGLAEGLAESPREVITRGAKALSELRDAQRLGQSRLDVSQDARKAFDGGRLVAPDQERSQQLSKQAIPFQLGSGARLVHEFSQSLYPFGLRCCARFCQSTSDMH